MPLYLVVHGTVEVDVLMTFDGLLGDDGHGGVDAHRRATGHLGQLQIEHRLFSFISMNWRGKPLTTYRTVVELIAGTTTRTGLRVQADLDTGNYPIGVKITDKQLEAVPLKRHDWHPDWNYTILPP